MKVSTQTISTALSLLVTVGLIVSVAAIVVVLKETHDTTTLLGNTAHLSQELRQSSDDLTRFIRTFTVTGNESYWNFFQDVISIRNGKSPLPVEPWRNHWDLFIVDGVAPRGFGAPNALRARIKDALFTTDEIALLDLAQSRSDALIDLEDVANNAMRGKYRPTNTTGLTAAQAKAFSVTATPNQTLAMELVHGIDYHREKGGIMKPLDDFAAKATRRVQDRSDLVFMISIGIASLIAVLSVLSAAVAVMTHCHQSKQLHEALELAQHVAAKLAVYDTEAASGILATVLAEHSCPQPCDTVKGGGVKGRGIQSTDSDGNDDQTVVDGRNGNETVHHDRGVPKPGAGAGDEVDSPVAMIAAALQTITENMTLYRPHLPGWVVEQALRRANKKMRGAAGHVDLDDSSTDDDDDDDDEEEEISDDEIHHPSTDASTAEHSDSSGCSHSLPSDHRSAARRRRQGVGPGQCQGRDRDEATIATRRRFTDSGISVESSTISTSLDGLSTPRSAVARVVSAVFTRTSSIDSGHRTIGDSAGAGAVMMIAPNLSGARVVAGATPGTAGRGGEGTGGGGGDAVNMALFQSQHHAHNDHANDAASTPGHMNDDRGRHHHHHHHHQQLSGQATLPSGPQRKAAMDSRRRESTEKRTKGRSHGTFASRVRGEVSRVVLCQVSFDIDAGSGTSTFVAAMHAVSDAVHVAASVTSAAVHGFACDTVMVSWGAARKVVQPDAKAASFMLKVRAALEGNQHVTISAAALSGEARPMLAGRGNQQALSVYTLWRPALEAAAAYARATKSLVLGRGVERDAKYVTTIRAVAVVAAPKPQRLNAHIRPLNSLPIPAAHAAPAAPAAHASPSVASAGSWATAERPSTTGSNQKLHSDLPTLRGPPNGPHHPQDCSDRSHAQLPRQSVVEFTPLPRPVHNTTFAPTTMSSNAEQAPLPHHHLPLAAHHRGGLRKNSCEHHHSLDSRQNTGARSQPKVGVCGNDELTQRTLSMRGGGSSLQQRSFEGQAVPKFNSVQSGVKDFCCELSWPVETETVKLFEVLSFRNDAEDEWLYVVDGKGDTTDSVIEKSLERVLEDPSSAVEVLGALQALPGEVLQAATVQWLLGRLQAIADGQADTIVF